MMLVTCAFSGLDPAYTRSAIPEGFCGFSYVSASCTTALFGDVVSSYNRLARDSLNYFRTHMLDFGRTDLCCRWKPKVQPVSRLR